MIFIQSRPLDSEYSVQFNFKGKCSSRLLFFSDALFIQVVTGTVGALRTYPNSGDGELAVGRSAPRE